MTKKALGPVESVCPECLTRLTGRLVEEGNCVRMEKSCPTHGSFTATIWRGEPPFLSWSRPKLPFSGGSRQANSRGCPLDCGLCEAHGQRTCTALVEITSHCNLHCPVCFASSGGAATKDPDPETLKRMFAQIITQTGGCNLQLSGGEPTVRPDLSEIVRAAADTGFTFIQLNSNGLAFVHDPELAIRLRDAGLSSVFLQFDGVGDEVFATLRGRKLFTEKCRAIDALAAAGLGIVLVPTVVRGVNTDQLWQIIRFGLSRQPHVRGVHFQPMSYFGRFPATFTPDHVTLPELMGSLCSQSGGLLKIDDFKPPGCEHALCSFSAKYLVKEDGRLQRLGAASCDCTPKPAEEGALTSIAITARQWGAAPKADGRGDCKAGDALDQFLLRARTHTFSISAMAFQDAWNLSLERLRGCCIHVAQADGRLIPFCSFNLTARNGRSLHRPQPKTAAQRRTPLDDLVATRMQIGIPLSRPDLERAQLAALRRTVRYAQANSPLYRARLADLNPESLQTRADLRLLPFLTGADVATKGHQLLAVSQSLVSRVISLQTSGSTGIPKRLSFTATDLAATSEFFLRGMHSLIDNTDQVLVLLPFTQPDSVGDLLLRALQGGGIPARGIWPPPPMAEVSEIIRKQQLTSVVGLPQHLLALSESIGPNFLKSMLLCSDYASPTLRKRIETACRCETFLHYGATESGLGGAVECSEHCGCHIRESDLLIEIVDPGTGRTLGDGEQGEVVITTLDREAMPLLRYRTGDTAALDRSPCPCGGVTARLIHIRGRLSGCQMADGSLLSSQDLDDVLFAIPGLLDYRVTLDYKRGDRLHVDFVSLPNTHCIADEIRQRLLQVQAVKTCHKSGGLTLGGIRLVPSFTATHTVKRTLLDLRPTDRQLR
ncbi:MAG: radical SAM protein [Pseudomonadota bacterium]